MKNTIKIIRITVFIAVIGFSMVTCGDGGSGSSGSKGNGSSGAGGGGDGGGGGGGGGGSGSGSGGGSQNIAHSEPKLYYDIHFPLEASSPYTTIFINSTLCAGRLTCSTATLKRKIIVKRKEEKRRKKKKKVADKSSATDCVHCTIKKIVFLCQIVSITGRLFGLPYTVMFSIESYMLREILP
jgi:hypothetical protein